MNVCRDNVVGVVSSLRAERSGIRTPAGARVSLFRRNVRTGSVPHAAPVQWVPSGSARELKRLVCESDSSPPSSVDVKNE